MTGLEVELHGVEVAPPRDLMGRVWARDPGAWGPGEDDPAERLGWLDLPERFLPRLDDVDEIAEGLAAEADAVVLLGMGGSSLAPEVFARTQPGASRRLEIADSTHPAAVARLRGSLDLDRSVFVVSSKSGGTIETMSLYRYFRAQTSASDRFVAITDPATSLARLAADEGFPKTFLNPADIGGRYSALSYFGLVPAALAGIDLRPVLQSAHDVARACSTEADPDENPALVLGTALADLVRAGRDKLTFFISRDMTPFGDWVEQLLAESTGKNGTGVVPIVGEPEIEPGAYAHDRVFVAVGLQGDENVRARAEALAAAGHPVVVLGVDGPAGVGAQMFLWELATAVAGSLMKINPFDQPDVESAKRASRAVLAAGESSPWSDDEPGEIFSGMAPGDLAVVCAFAPRTDEVLAVLEAARAKLVGEHGVATMANIGPRYLHSTGQLHKGGPPNVRALVVLEEPVEDVAIPDEGYSFGDLVAAQAAGDARALKEAGRRVAQTTWERFAAWAAS